MSVKASNASAAPPLIPAAVAFTAVNNVRTWALDREVFQNIMRRTAETRHEQYRNFLRRLAPRTLGLGQLTLVVKMSQSLNSSSSGSFNFGQITYSIMTVDIEEGEFGV